MVGHGKQKNWEMKNMRRILAVTALLIAAGCSEEVVRSSYYEPGRLTSRGYPTWVVMSELPSELQVPETESADVDSPVGTNGVAAAAETAAGTESSEAAGSPAPQTPAVDRGPLCYVNVTAFVVPCDSYPKVERQFGYLREGIISERDGTALHHAVEEINGVKPLENIRFRLFENGAAILTSEEIQKRRQTGHMLAVKPIAIANDACTISLAAQGIDWAKGRDISKASWYMGGTVKMGLREWCAGWATIRGDDFHVLVMIQLCDVTHGEQWLAGIEEPAH